MKPDQTKTSRTQEQSDWIEELMEFREQVVSTTDCTGLIPAIPQTEAQAESYTNLYPIPKPQQSDFQNSKS